jgi:hypothetical protein
MRGQFDGGAPMHAQRVYHVHTFGQWRVWRRANGRLYLRRYCIGRGCLMYEKRMEPEAVPSEKTGRVVVAKTKRAVVNALVLGHTQG